MPDDLAALLASESRRPEDVPRAVEDRLWGRVGATIGLPPAGGEPPEGHGGADGGAGDGGGDGGAGDGGAGGVDIGSATQGTLGAATTAATSTVVTSTVVTPTAVTSTAVTSTSGAGVALGATGWLATATGKFVVTASIVVAGVGGAVAWPEPPPTAPSASVTVHATPRTAPLSALPAERRAPPDPSLLGRAETHQRQGPGERETTGEREFTRDPGGEPAALDRGVVHGLRGTRALPGPSTSPSSSAHAAPSASSPVGDDRLAAERELLERARASLAHGDAAGALATLSRHAEQHPRARLGDEREALRVRALVAAGRRDEARARFETFRARSPDSLLIPAMEAALGGS